MLRGGLSESGTVSTIKALNYVHSFNDVGLFAKSSVSSCSASHDGAGALTLPGFRAQPVHRTDRLCFEDNEEAHPLHPSRLSLK